MNKYKKVILLVIALLFLGASAGSAQYIGVYSHNAASLDWNSLSISGGSYYGNYYSWSRAYTTDAWFLPTSPSPPQYESDLNSSPDSSASSTTGAVPDFASANGSTTPSTISAAVTEEVSVPGDAFAADSLAQRGLVYKLASNTFTVSIDYDFLSQVLEAQAGYAYGYVRAWAQLRLWNGVEYAHIGKLVIEEETHNISFSDFTLSPSDGTLTLSYDGAVGQYILLEAGVDARSAVQKAVVPIPGAAWMLLSGLLGLVGIRRLRN